MDNEQRNISVVVPRKELIACPRHSVWQRHTNADSVLHQGQGCHSARYLPSRTLPFMRAKGSEYEVTQKASKDKSLFLYYQEVLLSLAWQNGRFHILLYGRFLFPVTVFERFTIGGVYHDL